MKLHLFTTSNISLWCNLAFHAPKKVNLFRFFFIFLRILWIFLICTIKINEAVHGMAEGCIMMGDGVIVMVEGTFGVTHMVLFWSWKKSGTSGPMHKCHWVLLKLDFNITVTYELLSERPRLLQLRFSETPVELANLVNLPDLQYFCQSQKYRKTKCMDIKWSLILKLAMVLVQFPLTALIVGSFLYCVSVRHLNWRFCYPFVEKTGITVHLSLK